MNEYQVAYDAAAVAFGHLALLAIFGLLVVPVWYALLFGPRFSFFNLKLKRWTKSCVAVLLGIGFALFVIMNDATFSLAYSLRTGKCTIIEGTVEDFAPKLERGRGAESFRVDGHYYEYTDSRGGVGFQQTSAVGGPMREGLQVRIYDVRGTIARLEIAD